MKHWDDLTKAQRIERWENVLRVLKGLSPHERRKHWNMAFWGVKTDCGTVACAAGHCALDSWFKRRGFKIIHFGSGAPSDDDFWTQAAYRGETTDVEGFFGEDGSNKIFFDGDPRSVGTVIKEVRAYIKQLRAS